MNPTLFAVGLAVILFCVAAVDQYFKGGLPMATLYGCIALTNASTLWVALK